MDPSGGRLEDHEGGLITPVSHREVSELSFGDLGQVYEGVLDDDGRLPTMGRRQSMDSCSNWTMESDVSHMTSDSKKKSRRSSRKHRSKRSGKRKGSSSGPNYSDVDLDAANRMLEEKDIVVSSLVKQVEDLQQQLANNKNKNDEISDVASEKDLAEELAKAKRLLAEKEVVTESLIEQTKMRQSQLDEKTSVIEKQNKEIARLKAKLASATGNGGEEKNPVVSSDKSDVKKDSRRKKLERQSSRSKLKRSSSRGKLKT